MKIQRLLIAILAVGASTTAAAAVLSKPDFISARVIERQGQVLVSAKVSRAGQSKVQANDSEVTIDLAGDRRTFKLRGPITSDKVEIGPYSREDAQRIVQEINRRR